MMRYQASHRYARISPRKARYVVDLIRGKSVNEAVRILKNVPRRAAPMIKKVLESAVANADQQGLVNVNALVVAEAKVDGGPMWKRYRPGPMGRAMRIRKRTAHINIAVEEREEKKEDKKKAVEEEE
jgi:large subunit ribosomal protein L22